MYLHLCYVTGTLKDVVRDVKIPWNPDTQNITVTTNSTVGSNEEVDVWFYDQDSNRAGGVYIYFYTQIKYYQEWYTGNTPFPTLPTEKQKTWIIRYDYTEQSVLIHCNEVEVLNVLITRVTGGTTARGNLHK